MSINISLSQQSKELLEKCQPMIDDPSLVVEAQNVDRVSVQTILLWFNFNWRSVFNMEKKRKKEAEFMLELFRLSLLKDIDWALDKNTVELKKEVHSSWSTKLKFILLGVAGTIVAGCEGFDGISTLLGVFSLPSVVILVAGLLFAVLSIVVFYGFNLVQVSVNLGVKLKDAPKLLDVYLGQREEVQKIRRKINAICFADQTMEELAEFQMIIYSLQMRFKRLVDASQQFSEALSSQKMKVVKWVFSGMAGLLFFGSGFFAGQSVAVFILGLLMGSVVPVFWPVILFSLVVGVAAFSLYWFVERVSLNQLISSWFGLDEEKIELLCDHRQIQKEIEKLINLSDRIQSTMALVSKVVPAHQNFQSMDTKKDVSLVMHGANLYAFHANKTKHFYGVDEGEMASPRYCNVGE